MDPASVSGSHAAHLERGAEPVCSCEVKTKRVRCFLPGVISSCPPPATSIDEEPDGHYEGDEANHRWDLSSPNHGAISRVCEVHSFQGSLYGLPSVGPTVAVIGVLAGMTAGGYPPRPGGHPWARWTVGEGS